MAEQLAAMQKMSHKEISDLITAGEGQGVSEREAAIARAYLGRTYHYDCHSA